MEIFNKSFVSELGYCAAVKGDISGEDFYCSFRLQRNTVPCSGSPLQWEESHNQSAEWEN